MKYLLATMEYPPDVGGVARYLGVLAEGSADWLAVASPYGPLKLDWSWRLWPRWLPLLWRLPRLLRQAGADKLLISHVLPVGYAALAGKVWGRGYAVIVHGLDVLAPRRSPWKRFWVGRTLRNADKVIAASQATAAIVRQYGVAGERLAVVNPPLSWQPEAVSDAAETDLARRLSLAEQRVILVAGRLVARKGVNVAITALKTLRDAVLLVAGEGPERKSLEALAAELGVVERTVFLGRLTEPELRDAYRLAEVVLYPSLDLPGDFEGFGIGAADAAIFSKPVVASRIGGLPEAVLDNETGLFVPSGDAAALAQAVRRLLDDRELATRLGTRAREVALGRTPEIFRQKFRDALTCHPREGGDPRCRNRPVDSRLHGNDKEERSGDEREV